METHRVESLIVLIKNVLFSISSTSKVTMGGIVFETEITSVSETISYPVVCVYER